MKKTLCRLALLSLPALFAASCGVDDFFGTDGGTNNPCAAGVTPYQIQTGAYMTQSANIISDTCQLGLTPQDVMDNRSVQNDGQGNITLVAADNSTILGTGMVSCNKGTLTQSAGINLTSPPCTYKQTSTVDMTVTSANTFNVTITYNRQYSNSGSGMTCTKPASCTIAFSATMKK